VLVPGAVLQRDVILALIERHCLLGRGVVAIGCAGDGCWRSPAAARTLFGVEFHRRDWSESWARIEIADSISSHPLIDGVRPFTSRGAFRKHTNVAQGVRGLLTATDGRQCEPVAWIHTHLGGRVFCTSMGSPGDFREPSFLRLLVNAVRWSAGFC
jgi:hypothetical protein